MDNDKKQKRKLTLQYRLHWVRIFGEGYDAIFTYEKAKKFLNEFISLELSARGGAFDLVINYQSDDGEYRGTAYFIASLNKMSKKEGFSLSPNINALKNTITPRDFQFSGVTLVIPDGKREKAFIHPPANLENPIVSGHLDSLPLIEYSLCEGSSETALSQENEELTLRLAELRASIVSLPHTLCRFDSEKNILIALDAESTALNQTRYILP
jgi:hypothetical protein